MLIRFDNQLLADHSSACAFDIRVNGDLVVEAAEVIRSTSKRFFYRGNESVQLQFSVTRTFATVQEAEVYLLTQFTARSKTGNCVIECGSAQVLLQNAILTSSPSGSYQGTAVTTTFVIVAPSATTDFPTDLLLQTPDTMIVKKSSSITSGAESLTIVFDAPFASKPVVTASVAKPTAGADNIFATVVDALTTSNGFTVELSAPVPATGYILNWSAIL